MTVVGFPSRGIICASKTGVKIVNDQTARKSCLRAGARWLLFTVIGLLAVGMSARTTDAQSAKIAATPPMGWNSWNKFACDVSDKLIREMADAIVSTGMKDAGYQFVNIDDCWQVSRAADGSIVVDPDRFPSGMKPLADYVHSKGLKFGVYTDAGRMTCQKPVSYTHLTLPTICSV